LNAAAKTTTTGIRYGTHVYQCPTWASGIARSIAPKYDRWLSALCGLISLAILAGVVSGCSSSFDDDGPTVAATTGIWADVAAHVVGDDATVEQLIPDGVSPHEFQLSAKDRAKAEHSLLLLYNGADLEAGIPIDDMDVPKFAVADHVGPLEHFRAAGSQEHPTVEEDEEGGDDPHVWMDPTRVVAALPALALALAKEDPAHAAGYRARAEAYARKLTTLDSSMRATLAAVPPENRKLVTSHDALGYFADHFGFQLIATPFPATGPEAEASAQTIDEVEDAIRESGVPTVFAEETDNPEVLEEIASDTGVRIEEGLRVEAPEEGGTYVGMLRQDAQLIAAGLRG
jgi:zinc/manganese transport system substrate-binding protein